MTNMNADVTIAIPFHKPDPRVRRAVYSVLNQTSGGWKLNLVSDGCESWFVDGLKREFEDNRIFVTDGRESRGLAARLNESIADCDTDFYMRMDADDVMHPDRVKLQIGFLHANPEVKVLGSAGYAVDNHDTVLGLFRYPVGRIPQPRLSPVRSGTPILHPSVVFRSGWAKANPYDESFRRIEDLELWIRTFQEEAFYVLPVPLIFVGVDASQGIEKTRRTCKEERTLARRFIASRPQRGAFLAQSFAKEATKVFLELSRLGSIAQQRRYSVNPGIGGVAEGSSALTLALRGYQKGLGGVFDGKK